MSDVILAVLSRPDTAEGVLEAAGRLASLIGQAAVMALAVDLPFAPHPLAAEALIAESNEIAILRQRDRQRIAGLRTAFEDWRAKLNQPGTEAEWRQLAGHSSDVVEHTGQRADVIVIARPMDDDDTHTAAVFRAALLRTERPVLVVPPEAPASLGRTVAVAWREDGRAIKAVVPALRFLQPTAGFHILQGVRNRAEQPPVPLVFRNHRIDAQVHPMPIEGVFGRALLDKAHRLGADLLVMGAYAHTPLREAIFGGVTRFMLEHADLPVLMRH